MVDAARSRSLRIATAVAISSLAFAACSSGRSGSDSSIGPTPPATQVASSQLASSLAPSISATNVASSLSEYVRGLVSVARIDQRQAVETLCTNWKVDRGDSQSVNDYLTDLLAPLDRVNAGDVVPSQEQISAAIIGACNRFRQDPAKFVNAIGDTLQMSSNELRSRVTEACTRYRARLARDKASGYTGNQDLDPFIRHLANEAGADDVALRDAVDAICPE